MRIGLLALLSITIAPVWAQNSDLGILVGVSPSTQASVSNSQISSTVAHLHGQIDYSIQLRETKVGSFYLELPLAVLAGASSSISQSVTSSSHDYIFFTPGIRWKLWVHSRVSLYSALGGGFASFGQSTDVVSPGLVSSSSTRTWAGAADTGAGLDFRVTRLISIRLEPRIYWYITSGHAMGHGAIDLGVGFHF